MVAKLDHQIALRLQKTVEDELVLEKWVLIILMLSDQALEHHLKRFERLLLYDLFCAAHFLDNNV